MTSMTPLVLRASMVIVAMGMALPVAAQPVDPAVAVVCGSKPGERQTCAADTTGGVTLVRSTGTVACELGTSWGFDQTEHLGAGRLQRRVFAWDEAVGRPGVRQVRARPRLQGGRHLEGGAEHRSLRRRALPESAGAGPDLHRQFREHPVGQAAAGHSGQQGNRVLPGLVDEPSIHLQRLRVDHEHLTGASRPGGARRLLCVHVQPARRAGRGHQRPAGRPQHGGAVAELARDGPAPDR